MTAAATTTVRSLRDHLHGVLHLPGEPGYDRTRLPWRRNVDPRPLAVAEAADLADVRRILSVARELDVPLAVQSTGHGALTPADGGLILSTARLRRVEVDPVRRTVRAGGGAVWGDVVAAAAEYGLAPLSGSSGEVGVAGYTLGGGLGWLSRRHGYAANSLLRAEVVTADGAHVVAGPDDDARLWWALRGGGGNFGVVTELELALFPVTEVFGGVVFFPGERAADVLRTYGEFAASEPEALTTVCILLRLPPAPEVPEPLRDRVVLAVRAVYVGSAEDGTRALAPLLAVGGTPLLGGFGPMPFAHTPRLNDPQPGAQVSEEHTDLFRTVGDGLVDVLLDEVSAGEAVRVVELRHWGGALAVRPESGGPAGPDDAEFSVIAIAPELDDESLPGARAQMRRLAGRLRPYATGGVFLNFLSDPGRTAAAYTPADHARRRELKRVYDPENVFRQNHHIPAA
jgi:hypothetical protein